MLLLTGLDAAAAPVVMKAGTAKAVITPDKPLTLVTGKLPTGKIHDIFARVLTLNDGAGRLVFVTYDLNCLDVATPILRERCRDELDLDPGRLILLATHNHAAPIQIVPANFEYGRWLADKLFSMIKEAIASEQGPVEVEFTTGPAHFVRAIGNAPADYDLQLLKVTRESKPIALLFTFPTHPMQSSDTLIDTGHPGYAIDALEREMPGVLAMYGDACGGNQFPDRGLIMTGTQEQVEQLGQEMALAVKDLIKKPAEDVTGLLRGMLMVISLPLAPPLSLEVAEKLAKEKNVPLDIGIVPYPHPDRGTNWIRELLRYHREKIPFPTCTIDLVCTDDAFLVHEYPTPREFECKYEEVIGARIGPLLFIAMQGEVCAPIGMRIKDAFRRLCPTMVTAYMGEHNLYIPTRELVRLDAYQAQVIRIQYASPVGWSPEVEDKMVTGVIELGQILLKD
jgi:hypothetical protein